MSTLASECSTEKKEVQVRLPRRGANICPVSCSTMILVVSITGKIWKILVWCQEYVRDCWVLIANKLFIFLLTVSIRSMTFIR